MKGTAASFQLGQYSPHLLTCCQSPYPHKCPQAESQQLLLLLCTLTWQHCPHSHFKPTLLGLVYWGQFEPVKHINISFCTKPFYTMSSLTKSIVATSEAVALNGGPILGCAIAVVPSSIVSLKTLLDPPSASLIIHEQVLDPTLLAAILWSSSTSNRLYRFLSCIDSFHSQRPPV